MAPHQVAHKNNVLLCHMQFYDLDRQPNGVVSATFISCKYFGLLYIENTMLVSFDIKFIRGVVRWCEGTG